MPVRRQYGPRREQSDRFHSYSASRYLGLSLGRLRHHFHLFVQNDAGERIELTDPRRATQYLPCVGIPSVPALPDAGRTEIDVLGVVFAIELRSQQPDHVHLRRTAVTG